MDRPVTRYSTPRAFLDGAGPFLLRAEVENNLILGITADLADDPAGLISNPYFATVSSAEGVSMAAFQTLPGRMAITRETDPEAVTALCEDVQEAGLVIDAILGPDPTVERFAGAIAAARNSSAQRHMRQRIHELTAVESLPRLPSGRLRQARLEDSALVAEWLTTFQVEIGEPAPVSRTVAHRIDAGELYLWDDNGPRSMAGWSGKTPHGIRVNAVYTPRELRGRGYATGTVAALSQLLLDQGNRFCCLYTDLANPTSNAIYKRIGYNPVSDASVFLVVRRET